MATLTQIGKQCGTDKAATSHSFMGKSYLDIYDTYFQPLRTSPVNVLEIGIKGGASLRTWKRYFPKGTIFGLDIDPQCVKHAGPGIHVTIGSQTDHKALTSLIQHPVVRGRGFDIIIDDGSHVVKHMLESFSVLWPFVAEGGYYIMEDLMCSYKALDSKHNVRKIWPGMSYNDPNENLDNDRGEFNAWALNMIRDMDRRQGKALSIQFWHQLCILKKE